MSGDPVVRWQVMRDLLDAPLDVWEAERAKLTNEGWVRRMLDLRNPDGTWQEGRWTGTVWTLCLLADLGLRMDLRDSVESVVGRLMPTGRTPDPKTLTTRMDLCHLGFWLKILCAFAPSDERLSELAEVVLGMQMQDGGWNCRIRAKPQTTHSSFHTTFNVLEGLKLAQELGAISEGRYKNAESAAFEFMLQHQMYRSDKTGAVIDERFLHLTYPSHWHYTVLRGLDFMRHSPAIQDPRAQDAVDRLKKRQFEGKWLVEKRIPGTTLSDLEAPGKPSRMNTLRCLRVLRCAGQG